MKKYSQRVVMIFLCGVILSLIMVTGAGAKDKGVSLTEKVESLLRKYEALRDENQQMKDALEEAESQVELFRGKFLELENRGGVLQKQLETRTQELKEAQAAIKNREGTADEGRRNWKELSLN
jgi:chromosome segregation ATPase